MGMAGRGRLDLTSPNSCQISEACCQPPRAALGDAYTAAPRSGGFGARREIEANLRAVKGDKRYVNLKNEYAALSPEAARKMRPGQPQSPKAKSPRRPLAEIQAPKRHSPKAPAKTVKPHTSPKQNPKSVGVTTKSSF